MAQVGRQLCHNRPARARPQPVPGTEQGIVSPLTKQRVVADGGFSSFTD